jgi:Spy/CpxP family protein refolding chaperone
VAPQAWASRPFAAAHGGHGFGGRMHDPAQAKQHVGLAVEFALRGVSATDEQRQQVRRIAERTIDAVAPAAEQHRSHREAIVRELGKPEIDRAAVERLRAQELTMADQASRALVAGLLDAAEVLSPEQRGELIELARRFHGEGVPD